MDHQRRSRPDLLTLSSPARPVSTTPTPADYRRQSQSPFRYVQFTELSEKASSSHVELPLHRVPSSSSSRQHPYSRPDTPISLTPSSTVTRSRRIRDRLRPWLPIILYVLSSLIFVVAIAFYKTEVFTFLDNLSVWLRADEYFGYAVLFALIFITTFPPVPMYSTLIILAGYTFGPWLGAVISYLAALSGAVVVFAISRTLLRDCITRWLNSACTIKRVVRAVEKRPKLLFLVRLAPYPYNVMNCLLAASPTLTFKTYTVCTAASLPKVIIHTSLGASIHSFKDYHSGADGVAEDDSANTVARLSTIGGLILCVAIFIYLSIVARRAVDEELGDDENADSEETAGFLANMDAESGARPMVQLRR
ncbi:hypothetical protein MIND_00706900 [Mycena indigotica]|uniref:Golgi apparatus membrane protein TVP38 n=1 Tax=Mycena indigotica TaxID=2126181 RepID=A0A8H6SL52_9AGAR|nr:uncharacterized protein MIND_00706900 [Mycena indigotica]KAF7301416.1 hypothetical protein MIND_00706900 [Mycena indigotica]